MVYLIWTISLIAVFFLGYFLKNTRQKIEVLEKSIKQKIDRPEPEPDSTLIDLDDEVAEAKYAMEQNMRKLNNIQPDE